MRKIVEHKRFRPALNWFRRQGWQAFDFQLKTWRNFLDGQNGLLNAPTGAGKTYALWLACMLELQENEGPNPGKGLKYIWVTPIRALASDIKKAMEVAIGGMGLNWEVAIRTGDTSSSDRQRLKRKPPVCLITTPESIHLMLSHKDSAQYFSQLKAVIVDEWHELMSTKRGVQMELALAQFTYIKPELKIWGISATIGNIEEALKVLVHVQPERKSDIIKAKSQEKTELSTILPDDIKKFPWAGHVGSGLIQKVLPIIEKSNSALFFTNTRSQAEIWYRNILDAAPHLAGIMALHHGSIDPDIRLWVETALKEGKLKLVVCTSSLDLGVDFTPVETVIQAGGPKGISRFFQRAGRSGHQPGKLSKIHFMPTHALEIVEGAALRLASDQQHHEERTPLELSFDVLVQFLVTLAVGQGFDELQAYHTVKKSHAYRHLNKIMWDWVLQFIEKGGRSLQEYEEFARVHKVHGRYYVQSRKVAYRHRLSIGAIVSDPMIRIKFLSGGTIGMVEESFIAQMREGDAFWFMGKNLELVRIKDMTAIVRKSSKKKGAIPRWMGGKLPLSSKLSELIRIKLEEACKEKYEGPEMECIAPLLKKQANQSALPAKNELLIEHIRSREGDHIFVYPFEGRFVHEVLSALIAFRIARLKPITFSIAMNDYGFELLTDQALPIEEALELDLFSAENLLEDVEQSLNHSELARRRFRDIAAISGLVFKGFPGKTISSRHLQSSSALIYDVLSQYEPDNLLIQQAREEVITLQLDYQRLIGAMRKINQQKIILRKPERFTPFAFPIMADRLRERLTTEKLADRLARMQKDMVGK
ncbi:MAG TPA: ligase-associated DNA damage response DEXH box helicase [Cytophagales bacterium]|mgnify:FL=1|jgi:ATP-dependent Lhr-like helicase|nr:ligase-associated DNA damage response DEXH box helicase [Cytophagales bacterium]